MGRKVMLLKRRADMIWLTKFVVRKLHFRTFKIAAMNLIVRSAVISLTTLLFAFAPTNSYEEQISELTWSALADVKFKDVYLKEYDIYYYYPTFGPKVLALEGREVKISGYVIPVDYDDDYYVLSAFPFAQCFFCGGAGPESVVDLRLKKGHRKFKTDERLTFKGVFQTNSSDIYSLNYILDNAEIF